MVCPGLPMMLLCTRCLGTANSGLWTSEAWTQPKGLASPLQCGVSLTSRYLAKVQQGDFIYVHGARKYIVLTHSLDLLHHNPMQITCQPDSECAA